MPSKTTNRVLTDHEEIRQWVEERSGTPARVKGTGDEEAGDPGILRIDFPGYTGEDTLEPISWDECFRKFDESGLALIVPDYTASGERSNFNKIVSRETAEAALQKTGSTRSRGTTTGRKQGASAGRSSAAAGSSSSRAKTTGKSTARPSTKTAKSKTASRGTKQTTGAKRSRAGTSASSRRTSSAKVIQMKKRSGSASRSTSTAGKSKRAQGKSDGRRAA
jgi:hypothetical protein